MRKLITDSNQRAQQFFNNLAARPNRLNLVPREQQKRLPQLPDFSAKPAEAEYNGAFKIIKTSNGYSVIDGQIPNSPYCGKCLISSAAYDVSRAVVAWTAGAYIEVYVVWDSARGIVISTTDNPTVPSMKIGIIQTDGTVLQLYQGGNMVIPGWIYLVTT